MLIELYTVFTDEAIEVMAECDETFECFYELEELFKKHGDDCYWNTVDYEIGGFDELNVN